MTLAGRCSCHSAHRILSTVANLRFSTGDRTQGVRWFWSNRRGTWWRRQRSARPAPGTHTHRAFVFISCLYFAIQRQISSNWKSFWKALLLVAVFSIFDFMRSSREILCAKTSMGYGKITSRRIGTGYTKKLHYSTNARTAARFSPCVRNKSEPLQYTVFCLNTFKTPKYHTANEKYRAKNFEEYSLVRQRHTKCKGRLASMEAKWLTLRAQCLIVQAMRSFQNLVQPTQHRKWPMMPDRVTRRYTWRKTRQPACTELKKWTDKRHYYSSVHWLIMKLCHSTHLRKRHMHVRVYAPYDQKLRW